MYLNISKSLNYSEEDAIKSKQLVLRLEQLDMGEFPKRVVESRNIREDAWVLMEEIRKLQHFVQPVMPDPQTYFGNQLIKKQDELRLKMYEVSKPLIDHQAEKDENQNSLYKITRPICRQVYDLLTQAVQRLPEFEMTRQIRIEKEFRELSNDAMGDVKVFVYESNCEVIGKIQTILLEAREKFTGEGCEMMKHKNEKIVRTLEILENSIERIDIGKTKETTVGQAAVQDVKERSEKK